MVEYNMDREKSHKTNVWFNELLRQTLLNTIQVKIEQGQPLYNPPTSPNQSQTFLFSPHVIAPLNFKVFTTIFTYIFF